jgi:hypothetical protein
MQISGKIRSMVQKKRYFENYYNRHEHQGLDRSGQKN